MNPPLPKSLSDVWCLSVPGSWVFLEGPLAQVRMQDAVKALEASGTRVLVAHLEPAPDAERIRIHVRVEATNPTEAAESARRMGWNVVGTFPAEDEDPAVQEARDHLRHYLSL
jgi:hypothetical protein